MSKEKYGIVKFVDDKFELNVRFSPQDDTVWLDQETTCTKNAHMGILCLQKYQVKYYNLDMIISVGYRVRSKRGIILRKWASNILKEYMLEG